MTPQPAVTDEFLIHYGWRETRNENAQTVFHIWFLIHYGWRETERSPGKFPEEIRFLIHYGWRETVWQRFAGSEAGCVSNPLRLEGDQSEDKNSRHRTDCF